MTFTGLVRRAILLVGGLIVGFVLRGLPGLLMAFLISWVLAAVTVFGYGDKRQAYAPDLFVNVSQSDLPWQPHGEKTVP